jgi:hypothetical protein
MGDKNSFDMLYVFAALAWPVVREWSCCPGGCSSDANAPTALSGQ